MHSRRLNYGAITAVHWGTTRGGSVMMVWAKKCVNSAYNSNTANLFPSRPTPARTTRSCFSIRPHRGKRRMVLHEGMADDRHLLMPLRQEKEGGQGGVVWSDWLPSSGRTDHQRLPAAETQLGWGMEKERRLTPPHQWMCQSKER